MESLISAIGMAELRDKKEWYWWHIKGSWRKKEYIAIYLGLADVSIWTSRKSFSTQYYQTLPLERQITY